MKNMQEFIINGFLCIFGENPDGTYTGLPVSNFKTGQTKQYPLMKPVTGNTLDECSDALSAKIKTIQFSNMTMFHEDYTVCIIIEEGSLFQAVICANYFRRKTFMIVLPKSIEERKVLGFTVYAINSILEKYDVNILGYAENGYNPNLCDEISAISKTQKICPPNEIGENKANLCWVKTGDHAELIPVY